MQVPLLDLKKQYEPLRDRIRAKMYEVAESQYFILGPEVEGLEREICAYTGANHAIGASSGTDAELAILMALGIGPGDAVVTTPYTFFATAGCIARVGARCLFVDIEPETFNISPAKLRDCLKKNGGMNIKAIIPVHLFGLAGKMDEIRAIGREYGVPVIEDAAQALGAEYKGADGTAQKCGAMGEFGFYSFFPSKNLGAFGDGGMIVCRDEAMAAKIRATRNHGMETRYHHHSVGGNFRLDALQAAILRIKLPCLDEWSAMRRTNAARYRELFGKAGLAEIVLPVEPYAAQGVTNHHIYNQFVIRVPRRDELLKHLAAAGIGHAVYYPIPLHLQECFAELGYKVGDFPESERAARETVALPIYPELTAEQIGAVVGAIAAFY